jgi:glycerol kinase
MKSILLAAAMALAPASQATIDTSSGQLMPQAGTVSVHQNELGNRQVEMLVKLVSGGTITINRVGVTGCEEGRGFIARVNRDGTPAATAVQWRAGGTKVGDELAAAICAAAHGVQQRARVEEMV